MFESGVQNRRKDWYILMGINDSPGGREHEWGVTAILTNLQRMSDSLAT